MTDEQPEADSDGPDDEAVGQASSETERERGERDGLDVSRDDLNVFSGLSRSIDVGRLMSRLSMPALDATRLMPRVELPPGFANIGSRLTAQINQMGFLWLDAFEFRLSQQISDLLPVLAELGDEMRGAYPRNISGSTVTVEQLSSLMMDEGLPIAWLPNETTFRAVLAAQSPAARRSVYGRRWRGVLQDCERLLNTMDSAAMEPYKRFLSSAIQMLRDGYSEGAQALAANTLDSMRRRYLLGNTARKWVKPEPIEEPDKMPVRSYFIASQLWGIYRQYYEQNTKSLPKTFNRHGSAHVVTGPLQYTRLNAVLAVAHLTSLMWMLDGAFRGR